MRDRPSLGSKEILLCAKWMNCRVILAPGLNPGLGMVSVHDGLLAARCVLPAATWDIEYKKGIRWMPWHQEAMKDVARCEKPWGAASRL